MKKNKVWLQCPNCKKERWVRHYQTTLPTHTGLCQPCARKEAVKAMQRARGKEGVNTGTFTERGYVLLKLKQDDFFYPMANAKGWIREHRLVMAKHLGRNLHTWEMVHHKGIRYEGIQNKSENLIDNLQLSSADGHNATTQLRNKVQRLEARIKKLEEEQGLVGCPSCTRLEREQ